MDLATESKSDSKVSYNSLFNKIGNIRLALIGGALSVAIDNANTTVVQLTDQDLNELLEPILSEVVGNHITASFLAQFGLYTPTVVAYLENLGYIITY
jgi:hypothetical protein